MLNARTNNIHQGRDQRRDCACPRARHRHGTRDAYLRDRCRCELCRAANNAHQRAFQRAHAVHAWRGTSPWTNAIGTRRRLQALTAAGWTTSQLAERMGVTKSAIAHLRSTDQHRVLATTAGDVAALYKDCWWRTPPGRYQARAERYAEARGWIPPWRWDGVDIDDPTAKPLPDKAILDEIAISEAIAGRPVPLTRAERRVLEQILEEQGRPAEAIARITGCHSRTIQRHRATIRSAA